MVGLEPTISRATIWRANQLRHTHRMMEAKRFQTCLKGFEPLTHGLEGRCSIQLSYKHRKIIPGPFSKSKTDGSYSEKKERVMGIEPTYPAWKAGVLPMNYTRTSSRGDRIRTCGILLPKQAL